MTTPELPPPIETEEQALQWLEELTHGVEGARAACDLALPSEGGVSARLQQRAYHVFCVKHGSALGALGALLRCRKISPVAYETIRARLMALLAPTITGGMQ